MADARLVAAAGLGAVYFGAEDYVADLGGRRTPGGDEVLYARSQVALAARLAGVPAVDQAVVALGDDERVPRDADGRSRSRLPGQDLHPPAPGRARRTARSPRPRRSWPTPVP